MNRNSALIWLPRIEAAGLPTPKTIIVPYSHRECVGIFDGEPSAEFDRLSDAVILAAKEIGFPVFIRTDLSSAKHSGPRAYKIEADGHNSPIFETLEDNEMKFWLEPQGPQAILVREFLSLESRFTAFAGLPVNREFRVFCDGSRVLCVHPYWPAEAVQDHIDDAAWPDWRFHLGMLHADPPERLLGAMAIAAVQAIGQGRWSVDFAQDVSGKWWLIDMATAGESFHWPGCSHATEEQSRALLREAE